MATVYITAVRMSDGGDSHEHISRVRWHYDGDATLHDCSVEEMIKFILEQSGLVKVRVGISTIDVLVADARPRYLRTRADGVWRDNLLALPRF